MDNKALAQGLAVDPNARIQSMGELIKRLDIPVSDKFNPLKLVIRHKLISSVSVAALAVAVFLIVTKPWIISADMLGISGSNSLNGGNFSYIEGKYAYYLTKNNALTVSKFDNDKGKFTGGFKIVDNAGNINTTENKVYFMAYDENGETAEIKLEDRSLNLPMENIYRMNIDGSELEAIYRGIAIGNMKYAKLSNGREMLYFYEFDTTGTRTLYSYDIKRGKKTVIGGNEIIWYGILDEYIYYTKSDDGKNIEFMRRALNGTGEKVLDDTNMYYNGICDEDGIFMLSIKDGTL